MNTTTVRLGDVVDLITKGTTPTTIGGTFSESGVPFVRAQNIVNGSVNFDHDALFINEQTHNLLKRSKIKSGDVLVAIAGTIGRVGVAPNNYKELNCNQAVALIRVGDRLSNDYLKYWLQSESALRQIRTSTVVGVISNLSLSQLANLELKIPPLPQQKRIAAILDKAAEIRAKREQAIAKLDELAQSTFVEMFGEDKWRKVDIAEVTEQVQNCSPQNKFASEFTYVDIGAVDNVSKEIINPQLLNKDDAPSRARQLIERDDVLVSTVRPNLNAVAKVDGEYLNAVASTGFCVLRSNQEFVLPEYIFATVKSKKFVNEMVRLATGASYPAVSDKIISQYQIPLPPIAMQRAFAEKMSLLKSQHNSCKQSLEVQTALIASLQHQAFTTGFKA